MDTNYQDGIHEVRWDNFWDSSSVALARNLNTGAVSAQFHVVFDDHLTTVSSDYTQDNVLVPPNFKELFRFSREQHYDQNDLIELQRHRRTNNDAK